MAVSEHGKAAIAREIAFGIDKAQVARSRGLTPDGLAEMIKKPEMQAMIQAERDLLATKMSMAMVHLGNQIEASVKNVIAIANDLEHKDAYKANMDIIGMFKSPKTESEQKIEVNINTEVINNIVHQFDKIMSVHAKFDPSTRLMSGDEAKVSAFGREPSQALIDALTERNGPDEN